MKPNSGHQPPRGERPKKPPAQVGRKGAPEDYSGFIIVRLSKQLQVQRTENLLDAAKQLKLPGLEQLLEEFGVRSSDRVVRSLPPEKLLDLERRAAKTNLPPLHSLTSYWRIDVRHEPGQAEEIVRRLNELVEVDLAYREHAVSDPLVDATNDTYAPDQDYLDAAPTGIDARWAWTQSNCEGAGVAFVDLEQGWFPNHEDLVANAPTLIYGDNMDGVGMYKGNHGTAVLGQIVGVDNTLGVVGIAPSVSSVGMSSHYDSGLGTNLHVADAIVAAIGNMDPGDALLLEVQRNYLPTETDDADFDAVRLAVALGVVVVEAAGNGDNDLDAYTSVSGDQILDRAHPDFRESGAIMVGASESALPHNRWAYSNYGSRIDCYGWGENIVTCGYGDLDDGGGDDDQTYTEVFGGTSGASPMITGAALILQGKYEATTGTRLSPLQMRSLLSNPATGTDQGPDTAGYISVMPDLRAIIEDTLGLVPDVYSRDSVGDTGVVPSTGSISASPDVIVVTSAVADPNASFGEGSGTENSNTLGFEAESGQDNFVYVRMLNRGANDATSVTATVYWSEVATLVTPDMWNLIGTTAPVDVPQGDTIAVAGPLTWPQADIPATGHYCFVAIASHVQDPAPPIPTAGPGFDWSAFQDLIRNQNNVTWRNFNVVDEIPATDEDPTALPFIIAGAPDIAREFDLEIILRLPKGARARLEVPLGLARRLIRDRRWEVKVDKDKQVAQLRLPSQGRIPLCWVKLAAGAKYRSRFLVGGAKGMERGGHGIAIRQMFEGEEVGRVTWVFQRRKKERKQ